MKIRKYLAMMLLAAATTLTFSSCSDDDDLGDAPRLFRPIASLEVEKNNLIVTWDNVKGATEYTVELYKMEGDADENGQYHGKLYRTVTCESGPYKFENLEWDERYGVKIRCTNGEKGSEDYQTSATSITYFSKINNIRTIDSQVRVLWKEAEGVDVIRAIKAVPSTTEGGAEEKIYYMSEEDNANGSIDLTGLMPETEYTFYAYKDAEVMDNSTYAGKIKGTTTARPDFDTEYGVGKYWDIRDFDPEEAEDTLQSKIFWQEVADKGYNTIILRGGQDYKVNNKVEFSNSVHFITGPTLDANARFVASGGMICSKNSTVEEVKFEKIDICSDRSLTEEYSIRACKEKGFGGRQVYNVNGTASTLNNLIFKNCLIEGFRAVVRLQGSSDRVNNITFDGCTINGVGDQGVVTTNNGGTDKLGSVTFNDCTISNIVMLCDLRNGTTGDCMMTVTQCTFCYAPIETTANTNTPLFRLGKNNVTVNISKSLFGPSMATEGSKGEALMTYTAGVVGSIFLDNQDAPVSASSAFKTNFKWYENIDKPDSKYSITSLLSLDFDEKKLWLDPENGDFSILTSPGESGIGATKWQN